MCRGKKELDDVLGVEKPSSSVETDDVEHTLSMPNMNVRKTTQRITTYPVTVPLGYSITEIMEWLDGCPVISHLQYVNAEHVREDTFPVELLTKVGHGVEKLLGIS